MRKSHSWKEFSELESSSMTRKSKSNKRTWPNKLAQIGKMKKQK